MNTKEKILFISSRQYIEKLNEQNLDYENHNRLFFCHLAALSFLTSGLSEFNLDLNYSYLILGTNLNDKDLGVTIDKSSVNFYTTTNALIQLNHHCTRSGHRLNNSIFGSLRCYNFKEKIENYLHENLKYPNITLKEYEKTKFNSLFLKLKIRNRKSEESQHNLLRLLNEQCPEIEYFLNYIKTKEKLVEKNIASSSKTLKI